jgi:hypothetical protein
MTWIIMLVLLVHHLRTRKDAGWSVSSWHLCTSEFLKSKERLKPAKRGRRKRNDNGLVTGIGRMTVMGDMTTRLIITGEMMTATGYIPGVAMTEIDHIPVDPMIAMIEKGTHIVENVLLPEAGIMNVPVVLLLVHLLHLYLHQLALSEILLPSLHNQKRRLLPDLISKT